MTEQIQMLDEEPSQEATALATYSPVESGLQELEKRMSGVAYDLTTTKGDKMARADRAECVRLRTSADGIYEAWNKPMLALQRGMRDTRDGIKSRILAIEGPVDQQIKADEARRKAAQAERDRVEAEKRSIVQAAINRITGFAMDAVGESSAIIDGLRQQLVEMEVSLEVFGDRTGEAEQARQKVLTQLDGLYASTSQHEEQQAELARQRAELAAQQEQVRKAREQQEAADKEARDKADAEAQTARIEQARIAQAEADRIAAAQKARADELAEREAAIAKREQEAREQEQATARAAAAELAEKQRIADEVAAAERKRLDDEATARREKEREAMQKALREDAARIAKEQAATKRLNDAAPAMHAALTVMVAKARKQNWNDSYPEELAQAVAALALVDGESA